MLKKIKLEINSRIDTLDDVGLPEGEPEITDVCRLGVMKIFGDEIKLSYKENGDGGSVTCDILAVGERVVVRRNGAIVSTLLFATDETYATVYEIPPYKFDMEVKTKRISNALSESGGSLDILYEMSVGGTRRQTKMKITVSEA